MKKRLVKLAALVMAVAAIMPLNVFAANQTQTAPMAEQVSGNEDIIGTWVDDPESVQPHVYEFWEEDGQLMYKHYRIIPGNGNGFGLKKTYTEFEYRSGKAVFMSNWGVLDCLEPKKDLIYSTFYHDPEEQTLTDGEKGKDVYHKMDDFEYKN